MKAKAHVAPGKKAVVKDYVTLLKEYPIVAVVDVENLPGKQLQNMREQLRGKVVLKMSKRRLITKAFEAAEKDIPGISKLNEYLTGMPALILTKENPFSLFKTLKKNQSTAPIKAGQKAPNNIIVPAGPTGFAPGPIIGELGGLGIKAGIENGKVAIKANSQVAKEGDVISPTLAGVLTRLGIEPMKVGLNLTAAFENGEIIAKSVLDIDEEAYMKDIMLAVSQATNLSFNTHYPTKDTIALLMRTAAADALALALEQNILTDKTAKLVLAKASSHASGIAARLPDEALGESAKAAKTAASMQPAAATVPKEQNTEKKPEEKKPEEAAAGLGSLFG